MVLLLFWFFFSLPACLKLCLLQQCCAELECDYALLPMSAEHVKGKVSVLAVIIAGPVKIRCWVYLGGGFFLYHLREINNFPHEKLCWVKHSLKITWDQYLCVCACRCLHAYKSIFQTLLQSQVPTASEAQHSFVINWFFEKKKNQSEDGTSSNFFSIFHCLSNIKWKIAVHMLLQKLSDAIFRWHLLAWLK